MEETLYLTVNLIDRFLSLQSVARKKLQLVGITAMLVACKYEEVNVPVIEDMILISDKAYTRKEVLEMVTQIFFQKKCYQFLTDCKFLVVKMCRRNWWWTSFSSTYQSLHHMCSYDDFSKQRFLTKRLAESYDYICKIICFFSALFKMFPWLQKKQLEFLASYIIELSLVEYEMLKFAPSLLAAAAVFTAQCSIVGTKQWSKTSKWHSTYSEDQLL